MAAFALNSICEGLSHHCRCLLVFSFAKDKTLYLNAGSKTEEEGVTWDVLQLSPTVPSHILIYLYSLDF